MPKNISNLMPIDAANLTVIGENEKTIKALKENSKESSKEANSRKLNSYCVMIASLAKHKLVNGNLPPQISSAVKMQLINMAETDMSQGMAEKMVKNTAKAMNKFKISGDNITPTMVADVFEDAGITSEAKLIKLGDLEKTDIQLLVEKIVGRRSQKKDADGNPYDGDKWIGGIGSKDKDQTEDDFLAKIELLKDGIEDAMRERASMRQAGQVAGDVTKAENEAINAMTAQLSGDAA